MLPHPHWRPTMTPCTPLVATAAHRHCVPIGTVALALWAGSCVLQPGGDFEEILEGGIEAEATVSAHVPTVITVRYEVALPIVEETYVQFGPDARCTTTARAHRLEDGTYEAFLVGSKPASEVFYRVVAETADEVYVTPVEAVMTGYLPSDLPRIEAETLDPTRAAGGYLIISLVGEPFIEAILDSDGDYVWFHEVAEGSQMVTRARLSVDGRSVLYLRENEIYDACDSYEPSNHIVRVRLDGAVVEEIPIGNGHHDFEELPDGTLAVVQADVREANDLLVQGVQILEIAPDGTSESVWTLWDHEACPEWLVGEDANCDWVHANALDYDPVENAYYLGMAGASAIWKIDRETGRVLWRLGPESSSFEPIGEPMNWFAGQHQFERTPNGILVFDNCAWPSSRVLEYDLSEDAGTVRQIWEHASEEGFFVFAMGEASRIEPGLTLVTWSTAGQVDQVADNHDVVWRLNLELGAGFGYSSWLDGLY
jgi:hypothetical protein